jgi:hypothetical protein
MRPTATEGVKAVHVHKQELLPAAAAVRWVTGAGAAGTARRTGHAPASQRELVQLSLLLRPDTERAA